MSTLSRPNDRRAFKKSILSLRPFRKIRAGSVIPSTPVSPFTISAVSSIDVAGVSRYVVRSKRCTVRIIFSPPFACLFPRDLSTHQFSRVLTRKESVFVLGVHSLQVVKNLLSESFRPPEFSIKFESSGGRSSGTLLDLYGDYPVR